MRSVFVSALLAASPALAGHEAANEAESGNFLPFSQSPNESNSYATLLGGYDTAHGGALLTGELQARLHRRFYLLLDGDYEGPDGHTFEPAVTGQLIVLEQAHAGVDVALFAGWEHSGFTNESDVTGRIAVARRTHDVYVLGNVAVGVGEHTTYGEVTLGGVTEVVPHWYAGVDSRGFDAASTWEIQAGPAATFVEGPFEMNAVAGVSALSGKTGVLAMLGGGGVF